jgi:hypothetical protein
MALVNVAYDELRQIARPLLNRERPDHTWGPTELVHETYLRLVRDPGLAQAPERRQFFFAAVRAIRRHLVEHARQKRGPTRGGGRQEFLSDRAHRIRFVYTPKHSSRMNQAEIVFGVVMRKVIRRGSFTSVEDLRNKIPAFLDYLNQVFAGPFNRTYTGRPLRV